ncbi:hypothetical protein B296_00018366 [Ensete ventricosum]|uniref:Uncharacterized protein n=1 Tax=Ensete ventricosum TaxID=4639 RepID=A0A426ZAL2_ENSVE|nr:hypothetical protein B296_00018366 [Ensete ventricosum]
MSVEGHADAGASALGPIEGCRGQWLGSSQLVFGLVGCDRETLRLLRQEARCDERESKIQGSKPRVIEQPPVTIRVDGKTWVDPPGCSVFGLLVQRSYDIGPPSSDKNITKLLGTPQLNLFTSECASPLISVGFETSCIDWRSLSCPRPECRSVDPSSHLGDDDPAHRPLQEWEG